MFPRLSRMDIHQSDPIRLFRDGLRGFVEAEMPREAAVVWDRDNQFPAFFASYLGSWPLVLGFTITEEDGGAGREIPATNVVIEDSARKSVAIAVSGFLAVRPAGMEPLYLCGLSMPPGGIIGGPRPQAPNSWMRPASTLTM